MLHPSTSLATAHTARPTRRRLKGAHDVSDSIKGRESGATQKGICECASAFAAIDEFLQRDARGRDMKAVN